ncbi:hypothetical protein EMPS_07734 [Entomortierella parvispora]|uniref:Methyltransferase domain-containing protein n=1 Tax=Entomortierella parvispora TaxID=205924 RepID=A0A9P3HF04_9FUNG|nr:hypothetical protein EMPS_07734 [Entomortierella parvispora]
MGATQSSLAHAPSPRAGHASNPAKSRNSFTKDRFLSHTLPTASSNNGHHAYPSPTNSASTIGSHHHLHPSSSAPGSPTQYHNHPQYTNHHVNNHHHHPQHSMTTPPSSQTSNSSSLQKTFSRRRSSNQTVESTHSGQCSVLHGSTTHSNTSHPLSRHSEESDQEFRFFYGRRFHNTSSLYMLPNDTQEVDRLHEQHYILKILFEGKNIHVSIKDHDKVIDLGCGAATWIMDMATELNHVDFVGIDISPIYPTAIHPKNCTFYQENILQGISQPNESFDIVYQRNVAPGFTFEHWQQGLGEAFRILRGDGWFESVESDVTIHNAGPYTEMCFEYLRASMASRNVDPSVVRDLDKLFLSTGFADVQVKEYVVAYGEHGGQLGKLWRDNMFAILETVKPLLARVKNVPESQVSEMIAASYKETLTCRAHQTIYVTYGRKPRSAVFGRR